MTDRPWIQRRLGAEHFAQLTSGLSGSELQSVLLEVLQGRAHRRLAKEILAQFQRDSFCAPAAVDQRTSTAVDAHLLAAATHFEAIELSPVSPLGTCASVALTDQNRVLSALRSTEVVSDPTNVLALHCTLRLREQPNRAVHFATCQRVVRAQPVPKLPGYTQHFRIFALASAGLEQKDHAFTVETVSLHIRTMLAALTRLEQHGFEFGARRVEIRATNQRAALADRIAELQAVATHRTVLEHDYYSGGIRYVVWVTTREGTEVPLIDGGTFDWVAKLSANRRAMFVASGAGAQLIPLQFCQYPAG